MFSYDFQIAAGDKNTGTVYLPRESSTNLPVIIYCHGWGGSRRPCAVAKKLLDSPDHLSLGPIRRKYAGNPVHEPVIKRTGSLYTLYFPGFLDHAQGFHKTVGLFQTQSPADGFKGGHAEVLGFKADRPGNMLPQQGIHLAHAVAAINEYIFLRPHPFRGVRKSGIRTKAVPAVFHKHQTARTFIHLSVMQLKSAQVETIGIQANQKGLQPGLMHQTAGLFPASGELFPVHAVLPHSIVCTVYSLIWAKISA